MFIVIAYLCKRFSHKMKVDDSPQSHAQGLLDNHQMNVLWNGIYTTSISI